MRPTYYLRKSVDSGSVERVPFERSHFAEAGVPPSLASGMPQLEAYQLVNNWNKVQMTQRFVYALE